MPWVNIRKQNVYLGRSETFCGGFQTSIYLPNWDGFVTRPN